MNFEEWIDQEDDVNPEYFCLTCTKTHKDGDCEFEGLCHWCKKRSATLHFGDMLSFTHGGGHNCCEICCATMQLDHAKQQAALIPEREETLRKLLEEESND